MAAITTALSSRSLVDTCWRALLPSERSTADTVAAAASARARRADPRRGMGLRVWRGVLCWAAGTVWVVVVGVAVVVVVVVVVLLLLLLVV